MAVEREAGRRWRARAAAVLALAACAAGAEQADAAKILVTTSSDRGAGSLRAAVNRANRDRDADVIRFRHRPRPIRLRRDLLVTGATEIKGGHGVRLIGGQNGAELMLAPSAESGPNEVPMRISRISGNRVAINVDASDHIADVDISAVNLTGGGIGQPGIYLGGSGRDHVHVSGSKITRFADAGVYSVYGTTRIDGSTIAHNEMGVGGYRGQTHVHASTVSRNEPNGGVFAGYYAGVKVTNSTISGNINSKPRDGDRGPAGGGIYTGYYGLAAVTNSTISGNSAIGLNSKGGGAYGNVRMTATTVTDNAAEQGGGIFARNSETGNFVIDTIVAGNRSPTDCAGALPSRGHNLLGLGGCGAAGPGDIVTADPGLAPLSDNGGHTKTHRLLTGSPAIGAAEDVGLKRDQRGIRRDSRPDIGAYELERR